MLAEAVFGGEIVRQRIGHYCLPGTAELIVEALRVGGRVCCVSAAPLHGLRVLHGAERLHVSVDPHDSRFRSRVDPRVQFEPTATALRPGARERGTRIHLHWDSPRLDQSSRHIVSIEDCVVQLIRCLPPIDAICALDSALEIPRIGRETGLPLLDGAGLTRIRARVSREQAAMVVDRSCGLSQAVGESVARCNFEDAGIPSQPQAPLPGGFFADLLIGRWLVFECLGEGVHTAPGAFDRDHARTAWLQTQGFHVVQFSHHQILGDWPMVLGTMQLLMRRGQHTHPF
ncbi:hypothetical protein GCM10027056_04540 [Glaciibacter psychrotolerans]